MRRLMIAHTDRISERLLGLHWLLRLRWLAMAGQTAICIVVAACFKIELPVAILAGCIGFSALSNALAGLLRRRLGGGIGLKAWLVAADVVVLTIMLYFTGGAHNPFTLFYLLLITMAVIVLPPWGAWGTVALCTAGFWGLFQSPHVLQSRIGGTCCSDMTAHLQGMVVAMVLTGCGIAYFVSRLTAGLRESRRMIAMAEADGETARRSMEVATLAAGIAHELATPLGTIAVVSQDLEAMAGADRANASWAADARVIRQEVERCRVIIEKLGSAGRTAGEDCAPLDWDNLGELLAGYMPEAVRERLELRLHPSTKRPRLPQGRLFQCLAVLIKNAAEASPPETPVTLEAGVEPTHCVFRVMDRGPGFPPGFEQRIGEPLVTTKAKTGGLGLGLYLVKSWVTELGGELRLDSGPRRETIVEMRLPLLETGP